MKEMDVEQKILAAIMFDSEACSYAFEHIEPHNFVKKEHQELYKDMAYLYKKGESIDIITLSEKSKLGDLIMDIGSQAYTADHIRSHSNILMDRWYLLEGRKKLLEAVESLKDTKRSPSKLRERCEEIALFLADRTKDKGLRHISEFSEKTLNNFNEIKKGDFPGVKTGFKKLDEMGFYLRKKTLTIIAARPGMGKSALALKIAKNSGVNTAFYSLEMAGEEDYERLISMETNLTNNHLRKKEVLEDYSGKIKEASEKINKQKIWINDKPGVKISTMASQCKRLKEQHGLGLLIVDYLGLAGSEGGRSRVEEVGLITKNLKMLAAELDIPVVPLAQLNRNVEERGDKRPILSDLRESGSIEQDAHMVWFIYRDELYNPDTEDPEKAEIIIGKNRSGPIGVVPLTYKKATTNFIDYVPPPMEEFSMAKLPF